MVVHPETSKAERIKSIEGKLRLRLGKPGYAANVEALEQAKAETEALTYTYRDKRTKRFVKPEYAVKHPDTTELVEPDE